MKSKITLLFAFLFLASISAVNAQDDDKDVSKGVRAGWQSSNLFESGDNGGVGNLSSFYVGVFGEKKLIPILRFGSGIEYSQVGFAEDTDNKFLMHYVGIPLYLKVKLGPVFALGGAAANFKVGDKLVIAGQDVDTKDFIDANFFDVPVFLGLGVKILMFSVEARYYWGTLDIDKSDLFTVRSQYFQIGAGISF